MAILNRFMVILFILLFNLFPLQNVGGLELNGVKHTGANIYGFSMTDASLVDSKVEKGVLDQVKQNVKSLLAYIISYSRTDLSKLV